MLPEDERELEIHCDALLRSNGARGSDLIRACRTAYLAKEALREIESLRNQRCRQCDMILCSTCFCRACWDELSGMKPKEAHHAKDIDQEAQEG